MRNNLDCRAQVFSSSFFIKDIPVNLSGGQIRIFIQILVDKSLIMSEVEICFGAVLRNVYLAVLVRAHGAGIDINVRIELLSRYFKPSCFKQSAKRSCCDSFSETGNNTACYKNIFSHNILRIVLCFYKFV